MPDTGALDHSPLELICGIGRESLRLMHGSSACQHGHAREVIELLASFDAIANSYPDLECEFTLPI